MNRQIDDQPSRILNYGDAASSGPTTFDIFMATLLFVLSGICVLAGLFAIFWLMSRHVLRPGVILCAVVALGLIAGMAFALFCAGRLVLTSERRQG